MKEDIKLLQQRMTSLSNSTRSPGSMDLRTQVLDLNAQVKLLQQRILGEGVQIGNKIFQSFEDLRAWV
ncbi:MAG: hypothetical protein ACK53Y_05090, partial [bacterium]